MAITFFTTNMGLQIPYSWSALVEKSRKLLKIISSNLVFQAISSKFFSSRGEKLMIFLQVGQVYLAVSFTGKCRSAWCIRWWITLTPGDYGACWNTWTKGDALLKLGRTPRPPTASDGSVCLGKASDSSIDAQLGHLVHDVFLIAFSVVVYVVRLCESEVCVLCSRYDSIFL